MSTPPKPGHTLDEPWDLMAASADLMAVTRLLSRLTHEDDGTTTSARAIEEARRLRAALSARISKHQGQ